MTKDSPKKEEPPKTPSIEDGKWVVVLDDGETWSMPKGATLRKYDSNTFADIMNGRKPKDAFALIVHELVEPPDQDIDVDALHLRVWEQAHKSPDIDFRSSFLLLDEWLRKKEYEGLPAVWGPAGPSPSLLLDLMKEVLDAYFSYGRADQESLEEELAQLLRVIGSEDKPSVLAEGRLEALLRDAWNADSPGWGLVEIT